MNNNDIKNKVCIITGGAGLIGRAFARICAENGAITIIVDINEKDGERLVNSLGEKTGNKDVVFKKCDITREKEVKGFVQYVARRFKKIDALVNNAYPRNKNFGKKFEDVTYTDFCENLNMHLGGYFLITREVAKAMVKQKYGNIINMGSIYGFAAPRFRIYKGTKMIVPVEYAAIKGGIINMTRYLASYLGPHNVRVNAISPGGVYDGQPKSFVDRYTEDVFLGKRMAHTDDLTGVLLFLLSDASRYITGQNIVVDGGWSL